MAWCALGGMYKATGASILTDAPVEYTKAVICVARELVPGIEISDWQEAATVVAEQNDDGGYDKIREAFRSAIAKLTPKKEKQETRELAGVA